MSEETSSETGSDAGVEGEPVVNVVVPEAPVKDVTAAFDVMVEQGLTDVSEAELRGEDVLNAGDETKPTDEAQKPVEKPAETPPAKAEAPPKGYVPTAAIREVREENRALKDRLRVLEAKVLEPEVKPIPEAMPEVRPDFKVLTTSEFRELSEDSPRDALVYMAELRDYEKAQQMTADLERAKVAREEEVGNLFRESVKLMEQAVPDLFEEGSTSQQELAEYAETIGFTKDMFYLTNPETMVILPGETEPMYLGSQAAAFIAMLAGLRKGSAGGKPAADQAALRKTIEAELRTKIESEVLSKIKTGSGKAFKSMSDIPSSDSDVPSTAQILTEAQFIKLTPAQQKAYLSGA